MCLFKAALYIYHSKNDKKNANFWLILILSPVHFIYTNYGVQIWLISYLHSNCASRKNHVNFMWNSHEIFTWNSCEKKHHAIFTWTFHKNCTWKGFQINIVWNSCELSHKYNVKLFDVKVTWTFQVNFTSHELNVVFGRNFTWKLREFSRVAQLAVHVL